MAVLFMESYPMFVPRFLLLLFAAFALPAHADLRSVAYNHSPRFSIDESALILGVRSLTQVTLDYMQMNAH
jgi:hypothetical protein